MKVRSGMFPEKPKRTLYPRRAGLRWLLIALIGLPVPATVLANRRLDSAQLIDILLIGVMLCCTLYLLYQAILWLLMALVQAQDITDVEESSGKR